jgi:toxin-antitoxin system PIN domain toxin
VRPALLDINVLLALAWPNHQHHAHAHAWFAAHATKGWATCSITQLGFIGLSSNPSFTPNAVSPRNAAQLLGKWTVHPAHQFLESPSAEDPSIFASALGHQQVSDAYLVEVARQNKGCLVTLDKRANAHAKTVGSVEIIPTA